MPQPNLQPLINQTQTWWTEQHADCKELIPQPRPGFEGMGLEYLWNCETVTESLGIPSFPMCGISCGWRNGRSQDELVQSLRIRIRASAVLASGILQNPDVQLAQQVASALVPEPCGTELTLVSDLIEAAGAQTVQGRNNALAGAGVAAFALLALYLVSRT